MVWCLAYGEGLGGGAGREALQPRGGRSGGWFVFIPCPLNIVPFDILYLSTLFDKVSRGLTPNLEAYKGCIVACQKAGHHQQVLGHEEGFYREIYGVYMLFMHVLCTSYGIRLRVL